MSEPNLFEEITGSFRGPQGWLVALVWIFALVFTVFFIWAAAGMLASEALNDRICYATLSIWAGLVIAMIKIWYWNRLDRNAILRAINERKDP
ncbi:MAG: DUF6768 family protein [Planctomycetota bacterium]|jgi:hypothetical protein